MVSGGEPIEQFEGTDWIKTLRKFNSLQRSGSGALLGFIGGVAIGDALGDS